MKQEEEINTDVNEFKYFYEALTQNEPNYDPFLFPIRKNSKDPFIEKGKSWKNQQVTYENALKLLEKGYNIGIAATDKDRLCIVDIDDMDVVGDFKTTLTDISRKRTGRHAYYFTDDNPTDGVFRDSVKRNIPLDDAGEVRANWQYVVAPGSFVPCSDEELNRIPEDDVGNAGRYTVVDHRPPENISFEELPTIFKQKIYDDRQVRIDIDANKAFKKDKSTDKNENKHSALWDLDITDIVTGHHRKTDRFEFSELHGSTTGSNMSISNGLLHCWRHLVSHNALTALATMAGIETCDKSGYSHNTGVPSYIDFQDGETVFEVWKYAKDHNYIPESDPVPTSALVYYALNNNYCNKEDITDGWKLPAPVYNQIIEESDFETGRTPIPEREHRKKQTDWGMFFDEEGSLKTKTLADHVMEEHKFITMRDNGKIYYYHDGVYVPDGEDVINAAVLDVLEDKGRKRYCSEVVHQVRYRTMVDRQDIQQSIYRICLLNGIYDRRTGQLEPHTPDEYFITQLPITYDPDATCPRINTFLHDVLKEEDIPLVLELIGYCTIPDYSLQKANVFYGTGGNGKSVMLNTISHFLGENNISHVALQTLVNDEFAMADLYGKLANIFPDLSDRVMRDTTAFKTLTGNEYELSAQRKYEQRFNFKNNARLIFSANKLPPVPGGDYAFFRRWNLVEFPYTFEEEKDADKNMTDKLTTASEMSGLFNMVMSYLDGLMGRGKFSSTASADDVEKEYMMNSDPVTVFVNECITTITNEVTTKNDLYIEYCNWCDFKNAKTISKNKFSTRLKKLGMVDGQVSYDVDGHTRPRVWFNCEIVVWPEMTGNDMNIKGNRKQSRQYHANITPKNDKHHAITPVTPHCRQSRPRNIGKGNGSKGATYKTMGVKRRDDVMHSEKWCDGWRDRSDNSVKPSFNNTESLNLVVYDMKNYVKSQYPSNNVPDIPDMVFDFAKCYPGFQETYGMQGLKEIAIKLSESGWR